MMHRRFALCLVVGLVCLAAGCTTKVKTIHEAADFDPDALASGRLGLGGFVAGSRLALEPGQAVPDGLAVEDYVVQSEEWAAVLSRQFLLEAPGISPWPWVVVADAVPATDLAAAHVIFARGGILRAEHLAPIAEALPELRYLALARLTGNEVSLHDSPEGMVETQREQDEGNMHGTARERALTVRRRVTVVLEVYDLNDASVVWSQEVRRERKTLYNYEELPEDKVPETEQANPNITVTGTTRQGPPFSLVLEDVCGELVRGLVEQR